MNELAGPFLFLYIMHHALPWHIGYLNDHLRAARGRRKYLRNSFGVLASMVVFSLFSKRASLLVY